MLLVANVMNGVSTWHEDYGRRCREEVFAANWAVAAHRVFEALVSGKVVSSDAPDASLAMNKVFTGSPATYAAFFAMKY
jgi:hypothetical protein